MKKFYTSFNIPRSLSLRASRFAVVCAALSVAWIHADAQTCRISMGVNAEGHKAFREVFEYDYVSDKPTFPGGDWKLVEYINHTRQYPREAYEKGIQGRVTCSFVVNTDGSISHVQVIKSIEESLNREAVRIFSEMPHWEPGRIDGQAVPVRVIWSVPFRK